MSLGNAIRASQIHLDQRITSFGDLMPLWIPIQKYRRGKKIGGKNTFNEKSTGEHNGSLVEMFSLMAQRGRQRPESPETQMCFTAMRKGSNVIV